MDAHAAAPMESAQICFQEVDNVVFGGGGHCGPSPPILLYRLLLHTVFYTIVLQNYTRAFPSIITYSMLDFNIAY